MKGNQNRGEVKLWQSIRKRKRSADTENAERSMHRQRWNAGSDRKWARCFPSMRTPSSRARNRETAKSVISEKHISRSSMKMRKSTSAARKKEWNSLPSPKTKFAVPRLRRAQNLRWKTYPSAAKGQACISLHCSARTFRFTGSRRSIILPGAISY